MNNGSEIMHSSMVSAPVSALNSLTSLAYGLQGIIRNKASPLQVAMVMDFYHSNRNHN